MKNTDWLIETKLQPPRIAAREVPRPLLEQYCPVEDAPQVTLVNAPLGYGKTTLISGWFHTLEAEKRPVAWLSLDEYDDDIRLFVAHLVAAFVHAGVVDAGILPERLNPDIDAGRLLVQAVGSISRGGQRLVLFLDDFHRISSPAVIRLMDLLIERQPQNMAIVIASRGQPNIQTANLHIRGQFRLVDRDALRFSESEVAAYFEGRLAQSDLKLLMRRTEGWPVAVQLVHLWLQRTGDLGRLKESFSGQIGDFTAYLAEQLFVGLEPSDQDFLLSTSILEQVGREVSAALTDRSDALLVLERFEQMGLPVTALDAKRTEYRYHQLFTEFLRDRLHRQDAELEISLHRAAAQWFMKQGFLLEATRHAVEAGDAALAARLIEEAGGWSILFKGGMWGLLKFRDLPEKMFREHPQLRLAQIYLMGREGFLKEARAAYDDLRRITDDFRSARGRDWDPAINLGSQIVNIALQIYEGKIIERREIDALEKVIAIVPGVEEGFEVLTRHLTVISDFDHGAFDKLIGEVPTVIDAWERLGNIPMANYMYSYWGRALMAQARLAEAEEVFLRSVDRLDPVFLETSRSGAVAPLFLAEIRYERGKLDEARHLLQQTFSRLVDVESWFDLEVSGYRTAGFLEMEESDFPAAQDLIHRAKRHAQSRGTLPTLQFLILLEARLAVFAGQLDVAKSCLDDPLVAPLLAPTTSPEVDSWRLRDPALLNRARFELAGGEQKTALEPLRQLESEGGARKHKRRRGEYLLLNCMVLHALGHKEKASHSLNEAISIAEPVDMVRLFAEEGDRLRKTVHDLVESGLFDCSKGAEGRFIQKLFFSNAGKLEGIAMPPDAGAVGPLTEREIQIMELISQGLSGKEIARELDIAESTIKTHRKNTYRKLGSSRRSEAVAAYRKTYGK